jgi:hypothetical protein
LSAAFFYESKPSIPAAQAQRIEACIKNSARQFKIEDQIDKLAAVISTAIDASTDSLPDDAFAVVFQNGDVTERHYPLRNAAEVKTAAAYLNKHRDAIPFADRRAFADRVMGAAVKFGADLGEHRYAMERLTGVGVCAASDAVKLIKAHVKAAGNRCAEDMRAEMAKVATLLADDPSRAHDYHVLNGLAEVLDTFDRQHGLVSQYGKTLESPDDVLFAVTAKAAAELTSELIGSSLTGNYYKRADLATVPLSDFAAALGDDFVQAVGTANAWLDTEKLAQIVPTLPRGDAELFDSVVTNAGVAPLAVKAAAARGPSAWAGQEAAHKPRPGSLWAHVR